MWASVNVAIHIIWAKWSSPNIKILTLKNTHNIGTHLI